MAGGSGTSQSDGGGGTGILDNNVRLYFLGIAFSCIGLHPWAGGGSRSFSWECFRFVDAKAQGDIITHKPEFVHNEFVQSASDYGLIGACLLAGLLGTLVLSALLKLLFEEPSPNRDAKDAWRLGALAALAGMLVQSCFSFVFHLLPGILFLGICLGALSRSTRRSPNLQTLAVKISLSIAAVACMLALFPAGWKGTRVTRILWPTHFSKSVVPSPESRIEALSDAIRIWPQATLYEERATLLQTIADDPGPSGFENPVERSIEDYAAASRLNPFDPGPVVNRANLLSRIEQDAEAEKLYVEAIQLQGGMEPGFRSHFAFANHYFRKGLREFSLEDPDPANEALERSAEQIEKAVEKMHWVIADMREPRVIIHESLGTAREAAGDNEGALDSYNFAATLRGGTRAHYRAGVLSGKMAVEAWSDRRPSEALYYFIEARKRIGQAGNLLPAGVSLSQRVEYLDYLDKSIAFLKGAKIEPKK